MIQLVCSAHILTVGYALEQVAPHGLYAEQLSGTAFTAPRRYQSRGPSGSHWVSVPGMTRLSCTQREQAFMAVQNTAVSNTRALPSSGLSCRKFDR